MAGPEYRGTKFCESAHDQAAVGAQDLKARYRRHVMKRGGSRSPAAKNKAIVVAARALVVILWHILATGKPCEEPGAARLTRRLDPERETRRLTARLQAPGHRATRQDAAA
jgi:transposase